MADITFDELFHYLKNKDISEEVQDNPSLYKYVLYARKSTKGKERQERSLPDQIDDCTAYAKRLYLKISRPYIQEKESAKDPDIRLKFRKMVDDVKKGNYDGIISWHPNRLARNMKEAGEIIDLLDKGIIKDLKFPSFSFENSSQGKVMLGISFVFIKTVFRLFE